MACSRVRPRNAEAKKKPESEDEQKEPWNDWTPSALTEKKKESSEQSNQAGSQAPATPPGAFSQPTNGHTWSQSL